MSYIGASPQTSLQQYLTIDDISGSFNGVLTSFALQVGGVAPVPGPSQSNQLLISLGGVIQEPDDTGSAGFRLSGGNIIFSSAPASSTAFFGVVLAGADYIYAGTNFPDGSVSAPSITFANDLDSGFYRTGSGELSYTSNGTFRLKIDSSGRIGLGTSNITEQLTLVSNNDSSAVDNGLGIYRSTGDDKITINCQGGAARFIADGGSNYIPFRFSRYNGTTLVEDLHISSSGNIGIGTSTARAGLTVALGGNTIPAAGANTGCALFGNATDDGLYGVVLGANTSGVGYIQAQRGDGTATTYNLAIQPNGGNVGIGTTSPTQKLDVNGNIKLADSGTGASFITGTKAGNSFYIGCDNSTGSVFGSGTAYSPIIFTGAAAPITFSNSGTEKVRIDSSGRLLVGTNTGTNVAGFGETKIQSKGDYASSITVINNENNANTSGLVVGKVRSSSIVQIGDPLGGLYFQGYDGSSYRISSSIVGYVDGTPGASDMPGRLVFSTTEDGASSPTARMYIYSDGSIYTTCSSGTNASFTLKKSPTSADSIDYLQCRSSSNAAKMVIKGDGDLENANNSYTGFSDIKLKENIVDAKSQWDDIKALKVRNYNFKESTGYRTHRQIGVIAQELELVSPGLVKESIDTGNGPNGERDVDLGTTTKSVNYSVLYMKAVKALQEAMERIETLEAKVAALEAN